MSGDQVDPVRALLRSWWLVLACTALGALVVGVGLAQAAPRWTSSTTLLVSSADPSSALTGSQPGTGDVVRRLTTEARVVMSDAVVDRAATAAGLTPFEVREAVTVAVVEQSDVLSVEATAGSADQAQGLARAVSDSYLALEQENGARPLVAQADALAATIAQLQAELAALPVGRDGSQDTRAAFAAEIADLAQQQARLRVAAELYGGRVSVLTAAQAPGSPSSPGATTGAALGAVLGFAAGVLLALARGRVAARPARPGGVQAPAEGSEPAGWRDLTEP